MHKATWVLPLLSAAYWASCRYPSDHYDAAGRFTRTSEMTDARSAICGFCMTAFALVVAAQLAVWAKGK